MRLTLVKVDGKPHLVNPFRQYRESDRHVLIEISEHEEFMLDVKVSETFSWLEIRCAFEMVADPDDWRGPIDTVVNAEMWEVLKEAIAYFTATIPSFETVPGYPKMYRVRAAGYRNGPAGP